MIELEIPESVADLIQGRTLKSVGAKHYMVLLRQAKKFYSRYAEYIRELRAFCLNYLPFLFTSHRFSLSNWDNGTWRMLCFTLCPDNGALSLNVR